MPICRSKILGPCLDIFWGSGLQPPNGSGSGQQMAQVCCLEEWKDKDNVGLASDYCDTEEWPILFGEATVSTVSGRKHARRYESRSVLDSIFGPG